MSTQKHYRSETFPGKVGATLKTLPVLCLVSILSLGACSEPEEVPKPTEQAQSAMAVHLIGQWSCAPIPDLPEVPYPWTFEFKQGRSVGITRRSVERLQDGRTAELTTLTTGPYQPFSGSFSYSATNVKVIEASVENDSNQTVQWAPTPELLEDMKSTSYSFSVLSTSEDEMLLKETVAVNRDLAEWKCQRLKGTQE